MANYNQLAQDIVRLVGGENNVISLAHCVTRLRFKLKNASLAKTDEIKKLDGVIKVMEAGGQYQVVIGTDVGGLGTLIASMASLISYKLVAKPYPELRPKYFLWFTLCNVGLLALLLVESLFV